MLYTLHVFSGQQLVVTVLATTARLVVELQRELPDYIIRIAKEEAL